jgi:hypothetical protein
LSRRHRALGPIAAATAAAILICGLLVGPIAAHSGEWGIFPDQPRSWPGAGLHVRGDVPSTGPIDLVMVGPGSTAVIVATVDDAPNGHFETTITVPAGMSLGAWSIEARAPGMAAASAPVELVAPPPPGEDEGEGPAASLPNAVASLGSAGAPVTDRPVNAANLDIDLVPLAAAALAVSALALLIRRTRRPDPSR